ncbi:MAG: S8 family serine peptidase, partial [Candidatus Hodarchaeales archaeon]
MKRNFSKKTLYLIVIIISVLTLNYSPSLISNNYRPQKVDNNFIQIHDYQTQTDNKDKLNLIENKLDGINSVNSHILQSNKIQANTLEIRDKIGIQWLLDQGFNGSDVRIGILDTGVANISITDLAGKVVASDSFVNIINGYSEDITSVTDNHGHGSKVASLAAGRTTGMAPGAEIISGKIVENGILGNAGYLEEETTRGVTEAIYFAVEHNASI